jgi:hypothetical protein
LAKAPPDPVRDAADRRASVRTRTISGRSNSLRRAKARQEQLLFDAEMTRALPLEEVQQDLARLGRGLPPRPLELQRREQPLVVLV